MKIQDLKIGVRLGFGFGAMIVLLALLAVLGIVSMGVVNNSIDRIVTVNNAKIKLAHDAASAINDVFQDVQLMMLRDEAGRNETRQHIEKLRAEYTEALGKLERLETTPKGKQLIAGAKEAIKTAGQTNNDVIDLASLNQIGSALSLYNKESLPQAEKIKKNFRELTLYQEALTAAGSAEAQRIYSGTRLVTLLITAIAIALALAVNPIITRSITGPVRGMAAMLKDIAQGEGDLTKRLTYTGRDEIGEACGWFNSFIDQIHDIIGRVSTHSGQMTAAAGGLCDISLRMAAGAEKAAVQTGCVATASEEMAATSTEVSQNSAFAAEGSRHASRSATTGAAIVQETIQGMTRIAEKVREAAGIVETLGSRSDQIGAIVVTIQDIADQTNLLALNAAIEAARAGDQGRGFAVVADEVRALAERTTRATMEISSMIKTIQQETMEAVGSMEHGVQAVAGGATGAARSGDALQEILEQINAVTAQVNQIAVAAEEQTATTEEINRSIQQISDVIGETAAGARDSSSSATRMKELAEELHRMVSRFKLIA